jgi:hypothetical protein
VSEQGDGFLHRIHESEALRSTMKPHAKTETLTRTPKDPVNRPMIIDRLLCCERSPIWAMILR